MSEAVEAEGAAPQKAAVRSGQQGDVLLYSSVAFLMGLGLVMVASASIEIGVRLANEPFFYFHRQLLYVVIGAGIMFGLYRVRLAYWENYGLWFLLGGLALLVVVLIPGIGREVNGARRWIALGPFNFQVSELVKLMAIVFLAGYMVRHGKEIREKLSGFLKPLMLLLVAAVLLLAEPDFGSAVLLMGTALTMLFMAGVRPIQFGVLLAMGMVAMGALAIVSPYRMQRLTAFMDPWADPYGTGFQLIQSLIAIGSGGFTGLGLGGSIQKLSYLPEAHTDFLFAVAAEELGLIGVVCIIALYGIFVWRAFSIGNLALQRGLKFGAYIAYGVGAWIGLQATINMGVNMGVLPTKGLTLPLMSYGGSSLLAASAAVGLLFRVQRETREASTLPGQSRYTHAGAAKL